MDTNGRNPATIALGIVVVAAFVLYMVAFAVPFTHTAVVTRFGEIKRVKSGEQAGLHWKWPWPIEQRELFDNRLRIHESKLEQQFTSDQQSITAMVYAAWRIGENVDDVVRYRKRIGSLEDAESKLSKLMHDAMGKVVGRHRFEHFVSTDPKQMKFAEIEKELTDLVAHRARADFGIHVATVGIKRLELPEDATRKVFDRMREERKQLAKQYLAQGESVARQIQARAQEAASNIKNRAEAEAIKIRGEGDVAAAKFYKTFAQHPELHNFIKELEALKKMLPKRSTLILDANQFPPFNLVGSRMLKLLIGQGNSTQPAGSGQEFKTKTVPQVD